MILKGIELKGIYKVKFGNNSFTVYDKKGNKIYFRRGISWWKKEYDERGNLIRTEDCHGYWSEMFYNDKNQQIFYKNSDGFWLKNEYDEHGNIVRWENSAGQKWEMDCELQELLKKERKEKKNEKIL